MLLYGVLLLTACNTPQQDKIDRMQRQIDELESQKQDQIYNEIVEPPVVPVPSSAPQQPSNALMKAKCIELGQNHPSDFTDKWKDKEHVTYKFYYSPVLDTCIAEMYIDRFVDDEVGSKAALYDILNNGGSVREIISHISWCVDGTIPGYSDQKCTTAAEFAAERKRILPDYY